MSSFRCLDSSHLRYVPKTLLFFFFFSQIKSRYKQEQIKYHQDKQRKYNNNDSSYISSGLKTTHKKFHGKSEKLNEHKTLTNADKP